MLPWLPLVATGRSTVAGAAGRLQWEGAPKPAWMAQVGRLRCHRPASRRDVPLSVAYAGVMPDPGGDPPAGAAWFTLAQLPSVAPRQRAMIRAAVDLLRDRLDTAPAVAFRLLPPTFTLGELQQIYELLLGRRLHKASFRRALQAAYLVQPTDAWRSEGRGRPAQLFRYAPRRRRGAGRRGVRFELLSGWTHRGAYDAIRACVQITDPDGYAPTRDETVTRFRLDRVPSLVAMCI